VFRNVHPKSLRPRDESGPSDEALRRVIRRDSAPGRTGSRGGSGRGRRAHTRTAGHRTTGK
jgi:hypothetical protein